MWETVLAILLGLAVLGIATTYSLLLLFTPTTTPSSPSESTYLSAKSPSQPCPLPSIFDDENTNVALSIIVPAYNEVDRLEIMVDEAMEHLTGVTFGAESFESATTKENGHVTRYQERKVEIIIVDDGSKDATALKALSISQKWEKKLSALRKGDELGGETVGVSDIEIRVVKLEKNRGKGGAVRHGILHSRGQRILFADADGASRFSDLELLEEEMDRVLDTSSGSEAEVVEKEHKSNGEIEEATEGRQLRSRKVQIQNGHAATDQSASATPTKTHRRTRSLTQTILGSPTALESAQVRMRLRGHGVVVGSRAHLVRSEAVVKRSFVRNLLMHGFHFFLGLLGVSGVRDTQCGFKLFTRPTARTLFPTMHLHRWSFDVELLLISSLLGIPIKEVPIDWHEVSGSKISIALDGLGMARDLLVLRGNLGVGRWGLPELWRVGDECR